MNKQTIEVYDQVAHQYDQSTADFWANFPRSIIKHFANKVRGGVVLNLGCGPSRDGLLLRQEGLDIVGLDASTSMASITKDRGFRVIQADASYIPVLDKKFSGIWAYTSLIHLPPSHLIPTFIEIKRVLKDDGTLAFGYISGTEKGLRKTKFSGDKEMLFNDYQMTEIDQILWETGFWAFHSTYHQPNNTQYGMIMAKPID